MGNSFAIRWKIDNVRLALPWLAVVMTLTGCVSGRILEGYPGYPFLEFRVPASHDTTFFALQPVLVDEGFELDFTERASGLVNTRPAAMADRQIFLSVVVDSAAGPGSDETVAGASPASRVWIAAYEPERGGARRIDPLDEEIWRELEALVSRVSERLGGTPPSGP